MLKKALFLPLFLLLNISLFSQPSFRLEKAEFSQAEKTETLLTIHTRGWYSIRVHGIIPAYLTIIDRMFGPLGSAEKAEGEEGRLDLLLEEGEYKIKLKTAPERPGELSLSVIPYKEMNRSRETKAFPLLHDLDFFTETLNDLETFGYWLTIEEDEEFFIELAGRSLTSVSFWKDGYWKEDISFRQNTIEPEKGKPLGYFSCNQRIPAGTYLLQCIGGKKREWPEEEAVNPFYVRRGMHHLGAENYTSLTISPFGKDNYRVGGDAAFFQLIQDDLTPVTLTVDSRNASITKDSKDPWCSITGYSRQQDHLLTITGASGNVVKLLFFQNRANLSFSDKDEGKQFFISGFRSIEGTQNIDLTPHYMRYYDREDWSILKEEFIHVSQGKPYYRKINLLAETEALFSIEKKGTYGIREFGAGAAATYRFLLVNDPESQKNAGYKKTGDTIELINSYYLLEIKPIRAGILHFVIFHEADEKTAVKLESTQPGEPRNHFLWPGLFISRDRGRQNISLNRDSNMKSTIIKRELPLSLASPLPLYLAGEESISLSFYVDAASILTIQGTDYTLRMDNAMADNNAIVRQGSHTITLTNTKKAGDYFSVRTKKYVQPVEDSPRYIKDPKKVYEILEADKPLFSDFDRTQLKQYLMIVTTPALYRIETSGRLATSIAIRSPLITETRNARQNGVGRNALIQAYLKPGNYLIETETLGKSKGRCGIHLTTTTADQGGILRDRSISRKTIEKDHALIYQIDMPYRGNCAIYSGSFQSVIPYRLEEQGGWPLILNSSGDCYENLAPGRYFYYSLPMDFKTRRVTMFLLTDDPDPDKNELELNRQKKARWMEKPGRLPDTYTLTLPAKMTIFPEISKGMTGRMIHSQTRQEILFSRDKSGSLECDSGSYTIEIMSEEENNDVWYTINFKTDQLAPGVPKNISRFPADMELRNTGDSMLSIWSYGSTDTKAALWNADKSVLIAESDDMTDDWNFEILRKLSTGSYILSVEKQGRAASSPTTVFVDKIKQQNLGQKNLPVTETLTIPEKTLLRIPFATGSFHGLVTIRCIAGSTITGTLYQGDKKCADFRDELFIPLTRKKTYDLYLSHEMETEAAAELYIGFIPADDYTVTEQKNISLIKAATLLNPDHVSFTFSGGRKQLLYSPGREIPAQPVQTTPYNTVLADGWLINTNSGASAQVTIEPVAIKSPRAVAFPFDYTEHSFTLSYYESDILLLEARLPGKKTGLFVAQTTDYKHGSYVWEGMGLEQEKTLFGIPEKGEFRGKVWVAENYFVKTTPLSCALSVSAFPLQQKEELPIDLEKTITLEPGKGYTFVLQETGQLINLLLSQGLVAFHWYKHKPRQLYNGEHKNLELMLSLRGGILSIVNTTKQNRIFRINALKDTGLQSTIVQITQNKLYEKQFSRSGTKSVRVTTNGDLSRLCIAGATDDQILKADNGMLYYGEKNKDYPGIYFFPAKNGVLEVSHGQGSVFVWQAGEYGLYSMFTEKTKSLAPEPIRDITALKDKPRLFTIKAENPGFLHISMDIPGTMFLSEKNNVLSAGLSSTRENTAIFYYVSKGSYTLSVNPLNPESRDGNLRYTELLPRELHENEPEKSFFIGPEEYHSFQFSVKTEGLVGIGIKGKSDGLRGILYDASFAIKGEGPLIFSTLAPGDYYYLVYSDNEIIQYSLLLLGTEGSRTGIPYDVLKNYQSK
ncbi:MAG: hypothetical protein JXJ04_13170 [Spirochaetales bacterium]|nr:hypothetical protein [Spirochaetales bacterium]